MTIDLLLDEFIAGKTSGQNGNGSRKGNLTIREKLLVHYETTMLERTDDGYILNASRYSRTSGVLQNKLREKFKEYGLGKVKKVDRKSTRLNSSHP